MDGIEEADNQTQMDDNMRSVVDEMPADDDGEGAMKIVTLVGGKVVATEITDGGIEAAIDGLDVRNLSQVPINANNGIY